MILLDLILFKFILLFINIQCLIEAKFSKVVRTQDRWVQGLVVKTVLRQIEYSSFRGIPYAVPPIEELRFQPPCKLTPKRKGVSLAMKDANMCSQYDVDRKIVMGNEDCLYLNIYTPEVQFRRGYEKRAVMVWIHGGAFMWGSNNSSYFGPDYLVEKNVVVVAMNYRLGALGFLAAGNKIKGNMGLKDQVMALEWVKDNIVSFGGDPNKVTIFGESAGAVSVELHRLSPKSRGLFRASIAMSGSPLNPWAFADQKTAATMSAELVKVWSKDWGIDEDSEGIFGFAVEQTRELIRDIVEKDPTPSEISDKLKKINIDKILKTTQSMMVYQMSIPFLPTIEPKSSEAFLTKMPEDLYKEKSFSGAPHIIGYTSDEFIGIKEGFHPLYTRVPNIFHDPIELITSNRAFSNGIDKTMKFIKKMKDVQVWKYLNSFDYPQSLHRLAGIDKKGCGHADDIAHIFYVQGKNQPLGFNNPFAQHREMIVTLWTNFAKYLNPSGDSLNIYWPPVKKDGYFLDFDKPSELRRLGLNMFQEFIDDDTEIVFINETAY